MRSWYISQSLTMKAPTDVPASGPAYQCSLAIASWSCAQKVGTKGTIISRSGAYVNQRCQPFRFLWNHRIFKAIFSIAISNVKITALNNFEVV